MNRHIAFATLLVGGGIAAWWNGADPHAALGQLAIVIGLGEAAVAWLRRDPQSKPDEQTDSVIPSTSPVRVHQVSL